MADCAFPPFWQWLSLSSGNGAQAERRGLQGLEMGQRWETKLMTETNQDQEESSEMEKEKGGEVILV